MVRPVAGRCSERHGCGCLAFVAGHEGPQARRPTIHRRHILADETMNAEERFTRLQHCGHESRYFRTLTSSRAKLGAVIRDGSPEGQRGLPHPPDVRIDEVQRSLC